MDSFNVISYFSVVLSEDFWRHLYLKKLACEQVLRGSLRSPN